jgi:uncharacterized membrane protein SpoIIM required for sporulation
MIAGAAGLRLGYSLLDTQGHTRLSSLRKAGKPAITLVLGAACMLLVAALIEGFWSPSAAPAQLKWVVGVAHGLLLLAFFTFAGRPRPRDSAA